MRGGGGEILRNLKWMLISQGNTEKEIICGCRSRGEELEEAYNMDIGGLQGTSEHLFIQRKKRSSRRIVLKLREPFSGQTSWSGNLYCDQEILQ
jgi:hypothetical protein